MAPAGSRHRPTEPTERQNVYRWYRVALIFHFCNCRSRNTPPPQRTSERGHGSRTARGSAPTWRDALALPFPAHSFLCTVSTEGDTARFSPDDFGDQAP